MPVVTVAVAVPLFKQVAGVDVAFAVRFPEAVTVTKFVSGHPCESEVITVYVPAFNPVATAFVPPEGDQLYVYGGVVADVTVTVAEPVGTPQFAGEADNVVVRGVYVMLPTVEVAP